MHACMDAPILAELAAVAQRRLAASANLRDGGSLVASAGMLHAGARGSRSRRAASASPGARIATQQVGWSAREVRKSRAYDAVKSMGHQERMAATGTATAATPPPALGVSPSHAMLNSIIDGRGLLASPGAQRHQAGPPALQRQMTRYTSSAGHLHGGAAARPGSARHSAAAALSGSSASLMVGPPPRPRSARLASASASLATTPGGIASGMHHDVAPVFAQLDSLHAEAETLRARLDTANAAVESHGEVEVCTLAVVGRGAGPS